MKRILQLEKAMNATLFFPTQNVMGKKNAFLKTVKAGLFKHLFLFALMLLAFAATTEASSIDMGKAHDLDTRFINRDGNGYYAYDTLPGTPTYQIVVLADPSAGGIMGDGSYYEGELCTLIAIPEIGYNFTCWVEDGTGAVVSTSAQYSFYVTGNRTLWANFEPEFPPEHYYTIAATADPSIAGTVSGTGTYFSYGQLCYLTATPAVGYVFVNWTENGNVVSTDALYTFTVAEDRTLVANFSEGFVIGGDNPQLIYNGITYPYDYLPSFSHFKYSLSEQIYPAEELGDSGSITSIAFYNEGAEATRWYDIYLKYTTKSNFSSITDWEPAFYSDRVFSGSVTMQADDWTVITFDTPFDYDGINRVVLVVNDVTGIRTPESQMMSCRVFNTNENQALFMYSDNPGIDPSYPNYNPNGSAYISSMPKKNQLLITKTAKSYCLPSCSYYKYALSQQIYTVDELGDAGYISIIGFYNDGAEKTRTYDIYMKPTQKSCFSNTSDWEIVSESNMVFSGSVTMQADDWTYIAFDTPFAYDGNTNVVLVVDDNTGSYTTSPNMLCRVFNTDEPQAIYIYNNDTNYNLGSPAYTGARLSKKNLLFVAKEPFSASTFDVSISVNPLEGGTVSGAGTYPQSQTCTVTAIANEGYEFVNWTENDQVVSTDAEYSFIVSGSRNLVANFEQISNHWTPESSGYSEVMALTGVIQIDGVEQRSDLLEVAAFCGTECRGSQLASYFDITDRYLLWMTIYGENDDALTFKVYDHNIGQELDLASPRLIFNSNDYGDPFEPYVLNFTSPVTISQSLASGWNWFSTYVEMDSVDGLNQLEESMGSNGVTIKSKTQYTSYNSGSNTWRGNLTSLDATQMYMVQTNSACTVELQGHMADPADHPIAIINGWNWIGYPYYQSMSVNDALSGFASEANDRIKSRNDGYAIFISVGSYQGWRGTLNTLEPGLGYMYLSNSDEQKTLVFQTIPSRTLLPNITPENNFYVPSNENYANNMTITAVVDMDGQELREEGYELAAFVGNECRGSVKLMYVEPFNRYVAFLTVYGESSEEMRFVLTDGRGLAESDDSMDYVKNGIVGTLTEPAVLHFGTLGVDDFEQVVVNVFPNPSNGIFNVEGNGIRKIEVMDALGQIILSKEVEDDSQQINLSNRASGVYLLRVITDNGISTNQIIKK